MVALKKIISLAIGLIAAALVWRLLGGLLREMTTNIVFVGSISGIAAILGGVLANVSAEKILRISGKADV